MKIITIVGARPQFVKAAVVSRAFSKHAERINEVIIHTGQHYDNNMSEVFFSEMSIPKPHYNLGVGGGSHGQNTGRMLEKIEKILLKEKPDWVLVYGDTDSTLAGALAATKLHIPLAHVEAGLRSYNMKMPEEINRILTDRVSNILFCPTSTAVSNLEKEGFAEFDSKIVMSGDVMYDAALFYSDMAKKPPINLDKEYILSTVHRAENTDSPDKLRKIINALNEINKTTQVILPLHPRTKGLLEKYGIETRFTVIEPVGYLEMVYLIKNSKMIMTDSGGLQKEAYFFKKPCITLREETEWVELVEAGVNILVKECDISKLFTTIKKLKEGKIDYSSKLYGNGNNAEKIIHTLVNY